MVLKLFGSVALCGAETVWSVALCGAETVCSVALCGAETVCSVALCGAETVWSVALCGAGEGRGEGQLARSCERWRFVKSQWGEECSTDSKDKEC